MDCMYCRGKLPRVEGYHYDNGRRVGRCTDPVWLPMSELLRSVDRSNPEVRALAERLEVECRQVDELREVLFAVQRQLAELADRLISRVRRSGGSDDTCFGGDPPQGC